MTRLAAIGELARPGGHLAGVTASLVLTQLSSFIVTNDNNVADPSRDPGLDQVAQAEAAVSSKYYFLDVGVLSALQGNLVTSRSPEFGAAFETYILHELISYRDYVSADRIAYWRSASGFEVDFIVGDHTAVEVKATEHVAAQHLRSPRALGEERRLKRLLCVSLERARRQIDDVVVLPYRLFLDGLWNGEFR